MSNKRFTAGSYSYASQESQMAAFDRLPASVRHALNNAKFAWAPYPIWRRFERSGNPGEAKRLIKAIAKWDADQEKKDRSRVWRIGLPPKPLAPYVPMAQRSLHKATVERN